MFIAIIPAFNEAKHITAVIHDVLPHVDRVVVVDDASQDTTAIDAANAGAVVLRHMINRGQGAALETGHAYARTIGATYVLHFDGDGQFTAHDIQFAKETLINGSYDIVFGSRFLGKTSNIPFIKKYVLFPLGRIVNYFFAGVILTDVHNGFRIMNQKALHTICITQDGMAHATEILSQTKKAQLAYTEVPVQVTYHEYGQGLKTALTIVKDLCIGMCIKK